MTTARHDEPYRGFEQGPIRPPSEALSLLLRLTRGCPWNRCAFCPIYKRTRFSRRPAEQVIRDIDAVHHFVDVLRRLEGEPEEVRRRGLQQAVAQGDPAALEPAYQWYMRNQETVFLQDADGLAYRTEDLLRVLRRLRTCFPGSLRVTTYARSHAAARTTVERLWELAEAGLDRVHIGLESGSDRVLELVSKGVDQERQVEGGRRVVAAGLELSEYVMPGLGGRALWEEHARETARSLRRIQPQFVRLRTLVIPPGSPLDELRREGRFEPLDDREIIREIRLLVSELGDLETRLVSDHVLNLLGDLEGTLPGEQEHLLDLLDRYLALPDEEELLFRTGRRLGLLRRLSDLDEPNRRLRAEQALRELGITRETAPDMLDRIRTGFI